MKLTKYLLSKQPRLKANLRMGRMIEKPDEFIERSFRVAIMIGILFSVMIFFFIGKTNYPVWLAPLAGIVGGYGTYRYLLATPILAAGRVAIDMDREALFAGRFLLIKLNSGTPLVNAFVEASRSTGINNKYFLEIVRDIELGTPLEEAIEKAMNGSPSKHWRKILFQISNALRLGIEVTASLEAVLDDISRDYFLQIQRYGKKLSTVTLFYLLLAVVFPSLGMTIMVVLISFTSLNLTMGFFVVILVFVAFIQFIFMRVFISIRPKVNL